MPCSHRDRRSPGCFGQRAVRLDRRCGGCVSSRGPRGARTDPDTLRPYPAFDGNAPVVTSYVVPDLVVHAHDQLAGEFTVELVESALTRLRVRPAPRYRSGPTAAAAESVPSRTLIPPPTKQQTPTPQESRLRRPAGCQEDGQLGGRAHDEDHPVAISNFSAERTRHLPRPTPSR